MSYLVGCRFWEGLSAGSAREGLGRGETFGQVRYFCADSSVGTEFRYHLGGKTWELGRSVLGLSLDTPGGHPRVLAQSSGEEGAL